MQCTGGLTADAQVPGACPEGRRATFPQGALRSARRYNSRQGHLMFSSLPALLRLCFSICVSLPGLLCLRFFIGSTGLHFSPQRCGEADLPSRHTLSLSLSLYSADTIFSKLVCFTSDCCRCFQLFRGPLFSFSGGTDPRIPPPF